MPHCRDIQLLRNPNVIGKIGKTNPIIPITLQTLQNVLISTHNPETVGGSPV